MCVRAHAFFNVLYVVIYQPENNGRLPFILKFEFNAKLSILDEQD